MSGSQTRWANKQARKLGMGRRNHGWSSRIANFVLSGILCGPLIYFLSFAPAVVCFKRWPTTVPEEVLRVYRPLFLVAPNTMGKYSLVCGFTDIEAFLLVQSMQYEGGRMHDFDINVIDSAP